MNMTEIPQYMEFGTCLAEGRMDDAIVYLDKCIEIVKQKPAAKARLLQFRGNTLWQMGHKDSAVLSYDESLQTLPDSPLIMLGYARFLATRGLVKQTESMLDSLEKLINNNWQKNSVGEHSVSSYFDRIDEVKNILAANCKQSIVT